MNNRLSYFENTYKFTDPATIESMQRDEKGHFLTLDHTIFYPQGGGQPSDDGLLKSDHIEIPIHSVRMIDNEIRHYTNQAYHDVIGQKVHCHINPTKRLLHAKLHTSGHLISNIIEELYPAYKAVKGHHFPGECYVEFLVTKGDIENLNLDQLNQKIALLVAENQTIKAMFIGSDKLSEICPDISYKIPTNQSVRIVSIGNFQYQPCGGTHVNTTSELKKLEITKFKMKDKAFKIYYTMR